MRVRLRNPDQVPGERLGPLADDQMARELAEGVLPVEVYGR
jgi:hypothetical protein